MNYPIRRRPMIQNRGVALLIVLGFLVILFGLVTAFLLRTSIERQAAASFAASVSTAQLSDAAVNLVQGQIRSATTQGTSVAWASQPGMIRNFVTSGTLTRAFKLYSASNLIYNGGDWAAELAGDVAPTTWASDTAHWTDLNAPVMVPNPTGNSSAQVARYPILDPAAIGNVEGFAVTTPPAASSTHPMPMPVRWLYMLEDGTLTAPNPGTGATATIPGATTSNPIVGRVAFWTDDETCKLNINTASDGTYWDVPRVFTKEDMAYGRFQPAKNEFQRYPGHPGMTSLAPVFFATTVSGTTSTPNPLSLTQKNALYSIAPRLIGGGSDGGTAVPQGALTPDADRLFASVDELYFDPLRNNQLAAVGVTTEKLEASKFFLTASSRAPETTLFDTPRVAMWPLNVLTIPVDARSAYDRLLARCSTINDLPYYFTRSNANSPTEDFPGSPTATLQTGLGRNRNLYAYLQDLSARPIPGFGGSFLGKYGDTRDGILTLMFDYIRSTNTDDSVVASAYRYGRQYLEGPASSKVLRFNQVVPITIPTPATTRGLGRFPVLSEAAIVFIASADGGNGSAGGLAGSNVEANKTLDLIVPTPVPPAPKRILLQAGERRIEALFFMEAFIPGQGYPHVTASFSTRVTGLNGFSITPTASGTAIPLGFPSDGISRNMQFDIADQQKWGGTISARVGLQGKRLPARGPMPADKFTGGLPYSDIWPPTENSYNQYPFVSVPITVDATNETMLFSGGTITISIYPGRDATTSDAPVQTVTITFPAATIPIPKLVTTPTATNTNSQYRATAKEDWWTFSFDGCLPGNAVSPTLGGNSTAIPSPRSAGRLYNWRFVGSDITNSGIGLMPGMFFREDSDVVRTMVPAHSDFRLLGTKPVIGSNEFVPHPKYNSPTIRLAHSLVESYDSSSIGMNEPAGAETLLVTSATNYAKQVRPDVAIFHPNSVDNGDWDNGIGVAADGPYSNMPDGGNAFGLYKPTEVVPYYTYTLAGNWNLEGLFYSNNPAGAYSLSPVFTFFSPNRQIPSAGMFGSLPTGMNPGNPSQDQPYQTLLFRPQDGHPGAAAPADHLWTDLFWMPVVEPYAISEPFSTAGKINMNYQILPFRNITRSTALVGLLRSERMPLIPLALANKYKSSLPSNTASDPNLPTRPLIDIPKTLAQFQTTFDANDVYRSASQICDIHLVSVGKTLASVSNPGFWKTTYGLTGDNSRERPYTNLLGRLTTKSNTFTVHYRVQSLKQNSGSTPGAWNEKKDRVLAESRGSTLIERYINPNDKAIPDYPTASNPVSLGTFYKWRVVNKRNFAP